MLTRVQVPPFYLNLLLLNKGEALKSIVATKIHSTLAASLASSLANLVVKDETVLTKMAAQLEAQVPARLKEMGIGITVQRVFLRGAFVVFEMRLVEMEVEELVRSAKGEQFAGHFRSILDGIEGLDIDAARENVITTVTQKVSEALLVRIEQVLPESLAKQGIAVQAITRKAEDQASFFFDFLNALERE